jgi:H+/Na+-translocating ferredoxin:NAD+ oxidoreductase subunit B
MGEEIYPKLREFLDGLPGGFPATESGVEIKILKKLFTHEDAQMALCLTSKLETAETIAGRCGMEVSEAEEKLESMVQRGLIFRTKEGGRSLYQAEQFVSGIYEYQVTYMDKEFAELFEDYKPYIGLVALALKTKQARIIPVASAVEVTPAIASYDSVRELVGKQETIGLTNCSCREQQSLLGNQCSHINEGCMYFGSVAELFLERGLGRIINVGEALEMLNRSEEAGLVLQPNNAQNIHFLCTCCSCCCGVLKGLKAFPNPADFIQSPYYASKDPDSCKACGTCLERCPMDAIVESDGNMEVNLARCIGCGVCLSTCPQEAISLVPKVEVSVPPKNWEETLERISAERGLT